MTETKEYSKTLCDQRHMDHERYEELRFSQIEKDQCNMSDSIKEINSSLKEKFTDDAKNTRNLLIGVFSAVGAQILGIVVTILLKSLHFN